MRPRISIRGLVRPSVRWSVRWLVGPSVRNAFVKINEKRPFMDSEWLRQCWSEKKEEQGGRDDEEEKGTGRKEGRGGRSDEEEGATRRVKNWKSCKKKKKNEKVAWGRIVDLWVLLSLSFSFSLFPFFSISFSFLYSWSRKSDAISLREFKRAISIRESVHPSVGSFVGQSVYP